MKMNSSFTKTLAMASFIGVAAATTQAQTISWCLDRWGFTQATGNNGGLPVPNTTAGVVPAINWNDAWNENGSQLSATVNNLWDSSANNSGASITYSGGGWQLQSVHTGVDADGTYNRELLNGYLDAHGPASSTIAISAIPYSTYDLYVYFSSDVAGRAGTMNVGSTTYDFTTMGMAATSGANALFTQAIDTTGSNPTANADYAVFSGLSGSAQTITSIINGGGGLAGFQIVATPEPSTMALAVMGGFGVLLMKRRFKTN